MTRACVAVAQVQKEAGTVGERQAALKKVRALGRRGPFRALSRNSDPQELYARFGTSINLEEN